MAREGLCRKRQKRASTFAVVSWPRQMVLWSGDQYALSIFMPSAARNGCGRIHKNPENKRHAGNGSPEFLRIRLPCTLSAYGDQSDQSEAHDAVS